MSKPKPPELQMPRMTKEEKRILQAQYKIMRQNLSQSQKFFKHYNQNRSGMNDAIAQMLLGPQPLSESQQGLIDDITGQYKNLLMDDINTGITGQQLDRTRANSIAELVSRGVLNSTTGQRVVGDIEKERSRLISDAMGQAALQRLQMIQQYQQNQVSNQQAKAQLLSGLSGQIGQLSGNAAGIAGNIGQNVGNQLQNQRYAQFNVAAQNAQAKYLAQQQQSGIGPLIGASLGALAAPFTGGLSLAGGLALGSTLGGLTGSAFKF